MRFLTVLEVIFVFIGFVYSQAVEDPPFTHKVTFTIENNNEVGDLTIGLFGTVVPKTVKNFVQLSTGENGYGYNNTIFHRIIKDFMIQGGDIEGKNGIGGYSIYGAKFDDENFILKHDHFGRLSMANAGPNTQGSQFFITTVGETKWLDGHHVVFGQVTDGFKFLSKLGDVETAKADKPIKDVKIIGTKVVELKVDQKENNDYLENSDVQQHHLGKFWLLLFGIFFSGLGFWFFKVKKQYSKTIKNDFEMA
ncbi:hypothetical protein PACTADRAFT_41313 [Pachysolen tannophilus NRRL Y-2460]|uniref:Peptidyl-prolyl cis-trans isomerase n=1 Tax=Pachysolen tannophilus NRRL Y-2460 TaxID=669874 RepID=A0A1E4TWG9_PACTA|nr:hypothetical protein PACTADRAFT_41313 [Pachysolen tannophilus NRRL Y-2460]